MSDGIPALRKLQIGPEATAGTEVNATELWRGEVPDIEDMTEITFVEEQTGHLIRNTGRTSIAVVGGQVALPETPFTFEQFGWFLQAGVEAQQSGVADGAGSGYIYTHDFGDTATKTLKTLTVEVGDNNAGYLFNYGFCPSFSVRGDPESHVMMSGTFRGRQKESTTLTASLVPVAVHEAPFGLSKLYFNAAGGSFGGTQIEATMMGFNITVETGVVPVFTGDGELYYTKTDQVGAMITGEVVFRYNAAATTEYGNWTAETMRLMRLEIGGAAFATTGTAYSRYTCLFDLPIEWERFNAWGTNAQGLTTISGTFRAGQNATDGVPKIILVNTKTGYWS